MRLLILSRCRRYKQYLVNLTFKFPKAERSVILCRRQTESIIYQCCLSRLIAVIHGSNLWNRLMRLVDHDQKIIRKIVNQCTWRLSCFLPGQMPRIVFNSGTKSCLSHHFYIKIRSLRNTLCFQKLIFPFKITDLLLQFFFNLPDGTLHILLGHYIMRCRENCHMPDHIQHFTGQCINLCYSVYLITEKFNSVCNFFRIRRENLNHISSHPERSTLEIHIIAVILDLNQLLQNFIPVFDHARSK